MMLTANTAAGVEYAIIASSLVVAHWKNEGGKISVSSVDTGIVEGGMEV